MNIQTLVSLNQGKDPRKVTSFDFGHKLAMGLITPHLYTRELSGVRQNIVLKMHLTTSDDRFLRHVMRIDDPAQSNLDSLPFRDQPVKPAKRCGECMRDVYTGGLNKKDKRARINGLTRSSTRCMKCGLVRCGKKHLVKLCSACVTEWGQ